MQKPIMIMGAMEDVELNILIKEINPSNIVKESIYTYYEGKLFDYPVIVCRTRIGMVNAGVATALGIKKYNPCAIIIQGTAGAHTKTVHKNDIIVGTEVININSFRTPEKKEGEGISHDEWEIINFGTEQGSQVVLKSDEKLVNSAKNIISKYKKGNIVFGRIGSGDVWNREADRILMFSNNHGTYCEEMEGFAVLSIANQYSVPAIDIRIISNNELLGEEYERESGHDVQRFVLELVKEYIKN